MKKNILTYEPCMSNVPYLAFTLNVGQFGWTHARTAEEALNWLEAITLKVISFDMVLVSSLSGEELEIKFLDRLTGLKVPVVFLQRDEHADQSPAGVGQASCHPDNLLDWLNSYWGDGETEAESGAKNVSTHCDTRQTRGTG